MPRSLTFPHTIQLPLVQSPNDAISDVLSSTSADTEDKSNNDNDSDWVDEEDHTDEAGPGAGDTTMHTYSSTLTLSNLEACLALEEAVFPAEERASREKLKYRLEACNELCFGIFTIMTKEPPHDRDVPTYTHGRLIDEARFPGQKQVLIGMIIATKTAASLVTDESMELPETAHAPLQQSPVTTSGHAIQGGHARLESQPQSRLKGHDRRGGTIAIHTLGILPSYQRQGLGKRLLKGYMQRMEQQYVAERIALIAHGHLTQLYEGLDFKLEGESDAKWGGGGWHNLVYEVKKPDPPVYGRGGLF